MCPRNFYEISKSGSAHPVLSVPEINVASRFPVRYTRKKGAFMHYPVTVHKSDHGYDVHCNLLPGCHSQGDTLDEALANIKDAIKTYLEMVSEEEQGTLYEVEVTA